MRPIPKYRRTRNHVIFRSLCIQQKLALVIRAESVPSARSEAVEVRRFALMGLWSTWPCVCVEKRTSERRRAAPSRRRVRPEVVWDSAALERRATREGRTERSSWPTRPAAACTREGLETATSWWAQYRRAGSLARTNRRLYTAVRSRNDLWNSVNVAKTWANLRNV